MATTARHSFIKNKFCRSNFQRARAHRVLVVDDDPMVSALIGNFLKTEGYAVRVAANADAAETLLERESFSLMITDMKMPGRSGLELLKFAREKYEDLAVILVTAVDNRETAIHALQLGAYGYVIKPFDHSEIIINVANALERRRLAMSDKAYKQRLEDEVRDRTVEIRRREEEIVTRLISASEMRHHETGEHICRIGRYSAALGRALGLSRQEADELRLAASMHDIGKIGIPDEILLKAGPLDSHECEIIQQHTIIGARILDNSEIPLLNMARDIALSHHERWDGSGYPYGLKGEDIPYYGRIVAILDVYDALTHERVYKPAYSEEKSIKTIQKQRSHFDPKVYECFMNVLPALGEIRRSVAEKAEGD